MVTFNGVNVVQSRFPNNEVDYVSANRLKATCPAPFEEPCWDEFKVVYENNEDLFNLQVIKKWWDDAYPNNWARLVIDFFPYGQMDRDTGAHLFSLKYVAEIINDLNFRAVYICDPHSNVLPALLKHCHVNYPVEDYLLDEYYSNPGEKIPYDLIFYPDNGAAKKYSEIIDLPYRFGNKKRDLRTGEIILYEIIAEEEDIKDKRILIVDDICAGGRTFREAATVLRKMGAKKVDLYITHMMPQSKDFYNSNADGIIDEIHTADTLKVFSEKKVIEIDLSGH